MLNLVKQTEDQNKIISKVSQVEEQENIIKRINYKNNLLKYQKYKLVNNEKLDQESQIKNGIGRAVNSTHDQFVLTRINYPEFIWNQDPKLDINNQDRFFKVDAGIQWKLNKHNNCFMCDGHKYTVIAFKQGLLTDQNNESLSEIKDEAILKDFASNYSLNYSKGNIYTPIICGSVVNGEYKRMSFQRQLRMVSVEMYSLILISQCKHFIKSKEESIAIKNGVVEFCKRDNQKELEALMVFPKFDNWQQILRDNTLDNELVEAHLENINQNDFDNWKSNKNIDRIYVYANYLPPGEHKFIIFCPVTRRAFVKTMYVGINNKDFYPEWPLQFPTPRKRKVLNVWRSCPIVTDKLFSEMSRYDVEIDSFDLCSIIKSNEIITEVKNLVQENYSNFLVNHIEMLSNCFNAIDHYPCIDSNKLHHYTDENDKKSDDSVPIREEQLDLQFIRCLRNHVIKNAANGSINRSEFVEFIVRLGKSAYPLMAPTTSLTIIISLFLTPVQESSAFLQERLKIRQNKILNQVLHENRQGLLHIYQDESNHALGFPKSHSDKYFEDLFEGTQYKIDDHQIHKLWVYSLEYIQNDKKQQNKYNFLSFTEFMEFMIRVSFLVQGYTDTSLREFPETVKFYNIMVLMYTKAKILTPGDAIKVNEEIDISLKPIDNNMYIEEQKI